MKLVWVFLIVISAVRGIILLVELQRGCVDYFPSFLSASDTPRRVIEHHRNIFLTFDLFRKDNIAWECNNGGQLWPGNVQPGVTSPGPLPATFCTTGFTSLYSAFFVGILVDLVCQVSLFSVFFSYL